MHLRQLFAVQRCHQLPGSGLGGDEVLRQCHGGVGANITGGEGREGELKVVKERQTECWGTYPTTTSWPVCSPRPSTLNTTPTSIRGSGLVKVILAAISLPTTASPKGWWEESQ